MIHLNNLSLTFGVQKIFDDISCTFDPKAHIGLVGRNGAGKSTLLKIIAGQQRSDSGTISKPTEFRLAYMPQEVVLESDKSVYDEVWTAFDELKALQAEQTKIEAELNDPDADHEALLERYVVVQEKLQHFDQTTIQKTIESILVGLGFSDAQRSQPVKELSVGWRMRVVLAKLLAKGADFYLFDEPTNHLDIVTKDWFLEFLNNFNGGYLLITHDRYLLEKACSHIFELERGRGTMYTGNFTAYIKQKEERRAALEAARARQEREIAKKQETIDRFKALANKASMARSMTKQLERIELIELEPPMPTVHFNFGEPVRAGEVVLEAKGISQRFGDRLLFDHVHCQVHRGQKVAIVAANGVGKTTFFNLIAGKYPLQHGSVKVGHNVTTAFFEQEQMAVLNPNKTVLQEVMDNCPDVSEKTARAMLGSFLFGKDEVEKKIAVLSGGERNRVAMVKVLLARANFLMLDEPTNHLDLYAKEVLLQALQQYKGTLLFVSHDHEFLNHLATHICELTPTGMHCYPGSYESFLWHKKATLGQAEQGKAAPSRQPVVEKPQVMAPQQGNTDKRALAKELGQVEAAIQRLEAQLKKLHEELALQTYGTSAYTKVLEQVQQCTKQLEQKTASWEEITARLDNS